MFRNKSAMVLLRKAEDKLKGAETALKQGRYDDCISDAYYACFQSVLALMTIRGEAGRKHQYTRQWVNKELARTGSLSLELTKHYNALMDKRADADYSPEVVSSFTLRIRLHVI